MNTSGIAARQQCMFGSPDAYCGKQATIHVLMADGSPTLDCSEHAGWWTYHEHEDNHPVADDCGMPGTYWMPSTPALPGYCFVPLSEDG